jgi:hypothetical protein
MQELKQTSIPQLLLANLTATMEEGKGAHKSNDITATPMRTAVTPNDKQQSEREQEAPKKLRSAMKKGLKN